MTAGWRLERRPVMQTPRRGGNHRWRATSVQGDRGGHHVLAALAAGLLVVAGCTADEATDDVDQPTPTDATSDPTTPGQATTPEVTTPASPGDEATGDEGVAAMTFTECEAARYTVTYPQDWDTNDPGPAEACEVFHPNEVELPTQPQDRGLHWAVTMDVDTVAWEDVQPGSGPDEVIESRETTVDGRRAVVVEQRSTGEALLPEGERRYSYRVDLDGETLIASTNTVGDTDDERDMAVLDRMMDELVLDDGSAQDDAEAVARAEV